MYIATAYQTDSGHILSFSVPMYIGYNGELQRNKVEEDSLIPRILLPHIKWFNRHPCPRKQLSSRNVTITLFSGDKLQIAYPFQPGSANWFIFLQELASPEVVDIAKVGERCGDKLLRNSLGIIL
jgi:hypothetical protein